MSPRIIGVIIHIIFGEVRVSNGSAEKKTADSDTEAFMDAANILRDCLLRAARRESARNIRNTGAKSEQKRRKKLQFSSDDDSSDSHASSARESSNEDIGIATQKSERATNAARFDRLFARALHLQQSESDTDFRTSESNSDAYSDASQSSESSTDSTNQRRRKRRGRRTKNRSVMVLSGFEELLHQIANEEANLEVEDKMGVDRQRRRKTRPKSISNKTEGHSKRARALRALRPRVVRKVFARAVAFQAKQDGNSRVRARGLTQMGLVNFVQSAPAFGGRINAESEIDDDEPLDARTWEVLDRAFRGAVVDMAESTAQFGWRNVAAVGAAASDSDTDANEFNGSTAVDGVNNAIRTHFSTLCVQASLKHAWKKSLSTDKCIMTEARALACQSDVELTFMKHRRKNGKPNDTTYLNYSQFLDSVRSLARAYFDSVPDYKHFSCTDAKLCAILQNHIFQSLTATHFTVALRANSCAGRATNLLELSARLVAAPWHRIKVRVGARTRIRFDLARLRHLRGHKYLCFCIV